LGTVIRPVASRVAFIAGRMAQKWKRGNHSRLRRLFQPAPRCSTREAPSIPRKKMRLPPPYPPVHGGGNLILLLCRGIFPYPAGMRIEVIRSSDEAPTRFDCGRPAIP
jgi:hypothetical protein